MKLKLGFIGLGAMGLSHFHAMARLCSATTELTAICSKNPASIQKARAVNSEVGVFENPDSLIRSTVDAVFVSTPNFQHVELAEAVMKAGRHLFLEKPCGISRAECLSLLNLAGGSDRVIMVGHELRYSPFFQRIHEMVRQGEIGVPRMVWTREFRGPFQKKTEDWIQDDRKSGGCLVDKNCHHFDLMNWWVDAPPRRVSAFGGCAVNRQIGGDHQVNDHATVSFEYENGVKGTLQLCLFALDFPHEDLEMGIVGESGMLATRISSIEILQWKRGSGQTQPAVHRVEAHRGEGWGSHLGFDEIHQEFVQCILEGREPLTSVPACIDGSLLAIAAEESIKTGRTVEIPP